MKILLISICIVICVYHITNTIDRIVLRLYLQEKNRTKYLSKAMKHIRSQLRLTQLKECPKEELKQIPKDMIDWIDELIDVDMVR